MSPFWEWIILEAHGTSEGRGLPRLEPVPIDLDQGDGAIASAYS